MYAQSPAYHEQVQQNWLPTHLLKEMNLVLNEYSRHDKRNSELNEQKRFHL